MGYISINEEFLKEHKEQAKEDALAEDNKTNLLFDNKLVDSCEEFDITESGNITISFSNDLGFYCFDYQLTDDDLCRIISLGIKKLNKLKTVLEGLKN